MAAFAASQDSRKLLLCHCASRKRSEYVTCATVCRECLRRRQFAFIGPPAPVLFHELPSIVHHRRDAPPASPLGAGRVAASGLYATAVPFPLVISFTTTSLCGCFRLRYSAAS